MYTTATAFLEALVEQGVQYIFANFGSDHPSLIEALAEAKVTGRRVPRVVTCPNEMVALSIAQGFAQVTGRAQAVFVHVECGTQALAGAIHNASKARVPVLIFAGASPFTQEGELLGSRNEFIQWFQDVHDQRGLVRGYMRYDNEIRTGANVKQMVHRAMQFAHSDPSGPVYLMGAREIMEAPTAEVTTDLARWSSIQPSALSAASVEALATTLLAAERPLAVTSYLGRQAKAVTELVRLCRRVGVGVLESVPSYMNFPHDDDLYQGNQWNQPVQNQALAEADVVLVIDSDVPWIPIVSKPNAAAQILHIDVDPLKEQMPLWYIGAHRSFRADSALALSQLNSYLDTCEINAEAVERRRHHYARRHEARANRLAADARALGRVTIEHVLTCISSQLAPHSIVLNEGITNYHYVCDYIATNRAGSFFTSGGGSLGWNGGAAIGVKLANPEAEVVAITGDGSYMFSVPSSVHWIAQRYATPFLQFVLNNQGWNAPRLSTLAVHPNGYASRGADLDLSFAPSPDYAGIAIASGGAAGFVIDDDATVERKIVEAFKILREEQRCVVVDVRLTRS
jgi:acetolactate synthase-1/2/3 large subunit